MSHDRTTTQQGNRWIGAAIAAVGLYFILVSLRVLPIPGGPSSLHAPLFVVFFAGLVFFLAGVAVVIQALGRANGSGELPAGAPYWLRVAQYLIGVTLFASFAIIGSWVSIGGDDQHFSGGVPLVSQATNVSIARVAFGLGAIVCWLATATVAISGARKLFRHGKSA